MVLNRKFRANLLAGMLMLSAGCSAQEPVGVISSQNLLNEHAVFADNYHQYQPTEQELIALASIDKPVHLKVFFGTWCHDSEREVPRLLKLIAANQQLSAEFIALDREKTDPQGLAEANDIKYTPTIIVLHQQQELGRIIEKPEQSLAEDIANLIADQNL